VAFAVAAADAITDEEIVVSDYHAQNLSCYYSQNSGVVRPDNPCSPCVLEQDGKSVAVAEVFDSHASTVL
jgi:hypothetical protein